MKQLLLLTLILGVFLCLGMTATKATNQHHEHEHGKQTAKVNFDHQYRLNGALLFGEYLVVHDDDAKARGEECVFFYRVKDDGMKDLVVSYHCKAVKREKAESFKIIASRRLTTSGIYEIEEIQFAGTSDGHRVS